MLIIIKLANYCQAKIELITANKVLTIIKLRLAAIISLGHTIVKLELTNYYISKADQNQDRADQCQYTADC